MTDLLQNLDFTNSIDSRLRVLENKKPVYELPKLRLMVYALTLCTVVGRRDWLGAPNLLGNGIRNLTMQGDWGLCKFDCLHV